MSKQKNNLIILVFIFTTQYFSATRRKYNEDFQPTLKHYCSTSKALSTDSGAGQFEGGLLCSTMNGREQEKRDRPGAAATRRKTLPAWPFLKVFAVLLPAGGYKYFTEKTAAAAAAADAGAVFYQVGATGINAVQHYQEQARAASGFSRIRWRARAESVMRTKSTLCSARGE